MKNKKIFISAITLVFAVIAVVSTTFAWFTMNSENSIEGMDFSATAGEGLYVSATGAEGTYKSDLLKTDLVAATSSKGLGADDKLTPLTSADGKALKDTKNVDATDGFVEFKVYFRSQSKLTISFDTTNDKTKISSSATKSIVLDGISQGGVWTPANYETGALSISSEKATLTTSLANASRFSVVVGDSTTVYDLNADKGFKGVKTAFADSLSHQYLAKVSPTEAASIETTFGSSGTIKSESTPATTTTLTANSEIYTFVDGDKAAESEWYVKDITIRLWIEGFDNDCFDVLFQQALTANFAFKGEVK